MPLKKREKKRIKVVIDTNVFISSFFGGNPRRIISYWEKGEIIWCVSKSIIDEYIEILKRLGLKNEKELDDLLNLFAKGFNLIYSANTPHLQIVDDDPDDDKFIECAVALKSNYVVSGDKHLTSLKEYMGIKILTPLEFIEYMTY